MQGTTTGQLDGRGTYHWVLSGQGTDTGHPIDHHEGKVSLYEVKPLSCITVVRDPGHFLHENRRGGYGPC